MLLVESLKHLFQNLVGLVQALLELLGEQVKVLFSVLRHEVDAKAGLPDGNDGKLDTIDMDAYVSWWVYLHPSSFD